MTRFNVNGLKSVYFEKQEELLNYLLKLLRDLNDISYSDLESSYLPLGDFILGIDGIGFKSSKGLIKFDAISGDKDIYFTHFNEFSEHIEKYKKELNICIRDLVIYSWKHYKIYLLDYGVNVTHSRFLEEYKVAEVEEASKSIAEVLKTRESERVKALNLFFMGDFSEMYKLGLELSDDELKRFNVCFNRDSHIHNYGCDYVESVDLNSTESRVKFGAQSIIRLWDNFNSNSKAEEILKAIRLKETGGK